MVTFYNYPKKQWQHLRTTNPVESPFATDAAKRFSGKRPGVDLDCWWRKAIPPVESTGADERRGAEYVNGVFNQAPEEKAA